MHYGNLEDVAYCKRDRVIRNPPEFGIVGIKQWYYLVTGKEDPGPVISCIELGYCIGP